MNSWNHDTHIIDSEDGTDIAVIHGVAGEPDEKITLEEIKVCAKFFGCSIGEITNVVGDMESAMGIYLSLKAEARQQGNGEIEVNMLDMIPIMHKWLTDEALLYLHEKMKRQVEQCEN